MSDDRPDTDSRAGDSAGDSTGEPVPVAVADGHVDLSSRNQRQAERAIAASFVVATVAGLGLAVTYALGGQAQVEGALLFFCLCGLGFGITLWGRNLMPQGPFEQERENLIGSEADREAFEQSFERGEESFTRRRMLLTLLAGGFGALGTALVFPVRSLGPNPGDTLKHTAWKAGSRLVTPDGKLVGVDDLQVGGVYTVFPEGNIGVDDSQTLLLRVSDRPVTTRPGREDWSPMGYLAFSKLCTHAGCPVGLYEHDRKQMLCPCHQSTFSVLEGCRPVFGPATRSLPQLAITVGPDGFLQARGDYDEPVGPGFWNRSR